METINKTKPNVIKVTTPEDLAIAACDNFMKDAKRAISQRGVFYVAISGGRTPTRFFQLLAVPSIAEGIEWSKVHIFWVDERCVPPEAEASNYRLAANTFLDKVPIPVDNIHRMPGDCCDYVGAARSYEDTIRQVFGLQQGQMPQFDLIVLGMGTNGHIGSLFPNSYAMFDTDDLVSVVYFMDGNYNRITLTSPVLCASHHLLVLISGSEKADIVKDVIRSELDEIKYPVHTLWSVLEKVTWLVDGEAGKHL